MFTSLPAFLRSTQPLVGLVSLALFFGIGVFSSAIAAETQTDEAKPYTLYMGTDFAVEKGKDFLPVRDVKGKSFVVRTKKGDVLVPMVGGKVNLKIEQTLRITSSQTTASVAKLKTERAYTPGRDPVRLFNRSTGGDLADAAAMDIAIHQQVNAETSMNNLSNMDPRLVGPGVMDAARSRLDTANASQNQAMHTASFSNMNNTGELAFSLQQALAEELYDAMEVSFEVSSPAYLDKPYIVLMVRYHEKDAPGRTSANWIYARALPPIAAGAEKIRFLQGGLPPGFIIEECQLRLYNRGKEIATNVAPKQIELSADDAYDFLKAKHIAANKTATLSAAPALAGVDTAAAKSTLTPDQINQVYYVKVSDDGRSLGAFDDEACSSPVDPRVDAVIRKIRFYPALKAGKPIEGKSPLVLSQLSM